MHSIDDITTEAFIPYELLECYKVLSPFFRRALYEITELFNSKLPG